LVNSSQIRDKDARHIFLKNICSNSGLCIAFGIETHKIRQFFNNFTAFNYVVPPIRSIGAPSENGFVKEIYYKKSKLSRKQTQYYKSSADEMADNLAYEYMVGLKGEPMDQLFPVL